MNVLKGRTIFTSCAILILLFGGNVFGADNPASESLLPAGLTMQDVFKPGLGASVGKIELAQGEVVIIHANESRGYQARKNLLLYTGDTIVTLETGRTTLKLNDESIMTMAPETKLVINQSVYDPAKKTRSSYIDLSLGKARFWVTKFSNFKRSVFKVKTPTAVCGVRGSDFIGIATVNRSEFIALEKTLFVVLSLAFPEGEPLSASDFERVVVEKDKFPWKETLTPEEIEQLKKLFVIILEMVGPEWEGTIEELAELISDDELIDPDALRELEELLEDILEEEEKHENEDEHSKDLEEEILEEEHEDHIKEMEKVVEEIPLPDFPVTPF
jgi:hypothetical protein